MKKLLFVCTIMSCLFANARDIELDVGQSVLIGDNLVTCNGEVSDPAPPIPPVQLKNIDVRFYSGMCAIFGSPTSVRVRFESSNLDECSSLVGSMSSSQIRKTTHIELNGNCKEIRSASPYFRQQLVNKCISIMEDRR